MKKTIITIIIIAVIGVIAWFGYSKYQDDTFGGGGADAEFNKIDDLTSNATTTGTYCSDCPVKLLDLDADRRYAIIQNLSDTDIYLYATNVDLGLNLAEDMIDPITGETGPTEAATSTELGVVGSIQFPGILLEANGQPLSQIEFGPDNMVYGHIWATSSVVSKQIQINYK